MAKATTKKKRVKTGGGTGPRVFVRARYAFTSEEWKAKTTELTRAISMVEEKEDQIKATAATAKAELKELKSLMKSLANAVQEGSEEREYEAYIEFFPGKAYKVYHRHCPGKAEHGSEIKREPMQQADYEGVLPLDDEPPAREKAAPEPEKKPEASEPPANADGEQAKAE